MEMKTLRHTRTFSAPTERVYDVFMNAAEHAKFTAYDAEIDAREGGWFRTCGDRNYGYTLHLHPGHRIIQAWSHKSFPDGHYSVIDLRLEPAGEGTRMEFHHFAVPDECYAWLDEGWESTYWAPLARYLEG